MASQTQKPSARVGVSVRGQVRFLWWQTITEWNCFGGAVQGLWRYHGPFSYVSVTRRKQLVSSGENIRMWEALDQKLRNKPLFRSSSSPTLPGRLWQAHFPVWDLINKATSRCNTNIYMGPTKCQACARCGVLARSLWLNKILNVYA